VGPLPGGVAVHPPVRDREEEGCAEVHRKEQPQAPPGRLLRLRRAVRGAGPGAVQRGHPDQAAGLLVRRPRPRGAGRGGGGTGVHGPLTLVRTMPNLIEDLARRKLISPPPYLVANIHYLTVMGSTAYGCADTSGEEESDWDIYGFFIPPREVL